MIDSKLDISIAVSAIIIDLVSCCSDVDQLVRVSVGVIALYFERVPVLLVLLHASADYAPRCVGGKLVTDVCLLDVVGASNCCVVMGNCSIVQGVRLSLVVEGVHRIVAGN